MTQTTTLTITLPYSQPDDLFSDKTDADVVASAERYDDLVSDALTDAGYKVTYRRDVQRIQCSDELHQEEAQQAVEDVRQRVFDRGDWIVLA